MSDERPIGETLADQGRVVLLETRGRVSGRPARAAVGFIEEPDGSLLVAANGPGVDWARNLAAEPSVRVSRAGRTEPYRAEPLDGDDFSTAIRSLILRYGTPAEGLGSGPAFRLRPQPGAEVRSDVHPDGRVHSA